MTGDANGTPTRATPVLTLRCEGENSELGADPRPGGAGLVPGGRDLLASHTAALGVNIRTFVVTSR